jgi:hypothetical protein
MLPDSLKRLRVSYSVDASGPEHCPSNVGISTDKRGAVKERKRATDAAVYVRAARRAPKSNASVWWA